MLPALGLGTWRTFDVGAGAAERAPLQGGAARASSRWAAGSIDSSPMYGARRDGRRATSPPSWACADKLFLATKVWTSGRDAGVAQMEQSFRRLRAPPPRPDADPQPARLAHAAPRRCATGRRPGRIRYIGVTHYTASAYDELERVLRAEPLDFIQVNYSLGEREAERRILPLARDRGVAVLVNRPFAEGALFRRVRGRPLPGVGGRRSTARAGRSSSSSGSSPIPRSPAPFPPRAGPEHLVDNMKAGTGALPDPAARERLVALVS